MREVIRFPGRELGIVLGKTIFTGLIVACIGWVLLPTVQTTIGAAMVAGVMGVVYLLAMFALRLLSWNQINAIIRKFRRT